MSGWQALVKKARDLRDDSMKKVDSIFPCPESNHWGELPNPLPTNVTKLPKDYLTKLDYEIVETDPLKLVEKIVNKQYTSVQVAGAYLRASIFSHRLINCATEFLPELAYERAKYLDEYLEKNNKPVGPFHGLPISTKEIVAIKNHTLTRSITGGVDHISEDGSVIVDMLSELGANFHMRTTTPQTWMCIESDSRLWGITTNPFNINLTSGGSSAGEAASLGLHSSSIGIGTDAGGSIRWPASIQGQYGFKPTAARLPQKGLIAFMQGSNSIPSAIGPMTRDLESTILFTKLIIDGEPWKRDFALNRIKWDNSPLENNKKKIRIGVMETDGVVTPHPPIRRAINQVKQSLNNKSIEGYEFEIVPFVAYEHKKAWDILMGLYYEDGGEDVKNALAQTGEPIIPLVDWIINQPQVKNLTISELWQRNVDKNTYEQEYLDYWLQHDIDVLITPMNPGAATPLGNSKYWAYTAHWNLLDYPALAFPVTQVDPAVDKVDEDYTPLNEKDEFFHKLYNPEVYKDAPVGLQLVGLRNEDEKVLEIARLIDQLL